MPPAKIEDGEVRWGPPYVTMGPDEPDKEDWYDDDALREKVARELMEMRAKMLALLSEFYAARKVPYDVMLGFDKIGYAFNITSNGARAWPLLAEEARKFALISYQKEMSAFATFLQTKLTE